MWNGKQKEKDEMTKLCDGKYFTKEMLDETLIMLEKEEENILKLLSNNDYIDWVVTMLEKNDLIRHRIVDDCYEPSENISENDKNNLLLFTTFWDGIFIYLEAYHMEHNILITDNEETKKVEIKNYITIKYKDCYYDIGTRITNGVFGYCEKATSIKEYIEFNDILDYYSNVINERKIEQGKKLVKENK